MAATGGDFHECKERGVTSAGRILGTRDTTIGEIHPVPEASTPASVACRGPRLLPQQALLAGDPGFYPSKLCLPGTPTSTTASFACRGPRVAAKSGPYFV